MKQLLPVCVLCSLLTSICQETAAQSTTQNILTNAAFTFNADRYGIASLVKTNDVHPTSYIRKGRVFGDVTIRYVHNRKLDSISASTSSLSSVSNDGRMVSSWSPETKSGKALQLAQTFDLRADAITWQIKLSNTTGTDIRIEDLALPLLYNNGGGENPKEIFEQRVVKHHFISGNNSFIFWERPTGLGPYLVMVPLPGTSLEYFSTNSTLPAERNTFIAYLHSNLTGNKETRGTWRQPHTTAVIAANSNKIYGFKFRWANDYTAIRTMLEEEGLIDVQVMPGMTVPADLDATIALRTKHKIGSVVAEFGPSTTIRYLGEKQKGTHLYSIHFSRLGENKLTVTYGNQYKTYLEFFVTEPLETLYKKRASFIVNRQQHTDSGKWYNGLFGVYDMKNAQLRGPDNADFFDTSRLSYVLTCDDPGLCKAPFLAAKNVAYPNQQEINAVEYYIENFVWGGLQRTDQETPYAYGVYGTPNWKVNRDNATRQANSSDTNRFKMHVWRSYDYPHIMMMYYHMYQVAKMYPNMTRYLDKAGYLERAKQTAIAYFKYPYEILPWYETYKWGCYNELLIPDLIEDLKREGFTKDADFLTAEWEKKVKYFLYDDQYPFRSEYAIDATAFESSHALARYAMLHDMKPDKNLWFDKNLGKWHSHPSIKKEDAVDFMNRQTQANIALRGAIEPAYYYLGSDFRGKSDSYTLSYMSQMGGWSLLDYGLNFSKDPADYIRLGYQSYLSSFALINSGTAATNYGFWYPGKENDGASGWAFEPQKYATPWIQKPQGRGPWFYDGEIDLGFGGATRAAATIITNDPIFGLVVYGGQLTEKNSLLYVIPRDGLRKKLYYRNAGQQIDIELVRDGFQWNEAVEFDPAGKAIRFSIENRTADAHVLPVRVKGLKGKYQVSVNNKTVTIQTLSGAATTLDIPVPKASQIRVWIKRTGN
ncbi:MAG: DUF5695 domain-containing protein [Sediminibacterium sp.]